MMVANTAWILAGSGYDVLAIDWDLESPGLHRYFRPFLRDPELTRTRGLADGLTERGQYGDLAWLQGCAVTLDYPRDQGSISLVPAGQQDKRYAERVLHLSRLDLGEVLGGNTGIARGRQRLKERYDYVLIDGPTGVGHNREICNSRFPDALVALFTLNHKSITGTAAEAERARCGRLHTLRIFPIPACIEYGEREKLTAAMRYARETFAPMVQATDQAQYWNDVEIPYIPYYSFEEIPPALRDQPGSSRGLTGSHERALARIAGRSITFKHLDEAYRRNLIMAYGFGRTDEGASEPRANDRVMPEVAPAQPDFGVGPSWRSATVVAVILLLSIGLLIGILVWLSPKHDAESRINTMIDQLRRIEQSGTEEGIKLPKAEFNRAYTSLEALRDALRRPPAAIPAPVPNNATH
jgi:hypothetical protein